MDYALQVNELIWRRIGDEVVIITGDGLATHILNKTAARVWELCDGTHDITGITETICKQFEVSPEKARTDVDDVMAQLEELGLINGPAKV